MNAPAAEPSMPLDELLLAMDIADTARRQPSEDAGADPRSRQERLVEQLRAIYARQGIAVSDATLRQGVAALGEGRFDYRPPPPGPARLVALIYVTRDRWGRWAIGLAVIVGLGLAGYFLAYRPYQGALAAQERQELAKLLPAEMDALYKTIYDETKVQVAANEAASMRAEGKAAAARGDRQGAEQAVSRLTALRNRLRAEYTLRIADRNGVKPGFWTFPKSNTEATNYYIVVEAIGADGNPVSLPVHDDQRNDTETVAMWGLKVPQPIYQAVMRDAADDGVVEHSLVGIKQFGFLDVDYTIPVLGGTVTRW